MTVAMTLALVIAAIGFLLGLSKRTRPAGLAFAIVGAALVLIVGVPQVLAAYGL